MQASEIRKGDRFRYHPEIGNPKDDGKTYTVSYVGKLGNGKDVAWLKGKVGCVAIEALTKIEEPTNA